MARIAVIGQGAFGRALAHVFGMAGHDLSVFGRDYPAWIDADYIFLAVPTGAVEGVLAALESASGPVLILCAKGFLPDGRLPSEAIPGGWDYAVLSGPGFAAELVDGLPTIHSIAARADLARRLAAELSTPKFRLYWSDDLRGVQLCGALKNIMAIAAGLCAGLGLGENARAALITRGANELRRGVIALGGREETLWSPAGLGDLILTCTSAQSRNFRFGEALARGQSAGAAQAALGTVEGLAALRALTRAVDHAQMPITAMLGDVVEGRVAPDQALDMLMQRPIVSG